MNEMLISSGYPALFFLSFAASTLLPLGSEWLLVALILKGFSPSTTVAVATAGNYLGACSTYWIGLYGSTFLIRKVLRIDEAAEERARRCYGRFGTWSLFFSWLPVVGDPLCLAGGVFGVGFLRFSLLVFSGKLLRYASLALIAGVTRH
ncbi:MAG: DedA family protein [Myxococcota bacterium]|jgi:membrane protein YqaA with SNARE-associated domain|nr:DedA family protein [Myxococcota bacterium]